MTTVDLDFLIRKTPRNLQKLTAAAKTLGAMVLRPHYPVSGLTRLMRDDDSSAPTSCASGLICARRRYDLVRPIR